MTKDGPLRRLPRILLVTLLVIGTAAAVFGAVPAASSSVSAQEVDAEVPPGNPVIGSNAPGDVEPDDDTSYGLLAALAVCLIGAGVLLVKLERWERRRTDHAATNRAG